MIRHVLTKLGFLRSALAVGVGVPFLIAANAYGQAPKPTPTDTRAPTATNPATTANAPTVPENTTRGPGGTAEAERVIVTGSYIPTAETESALPVTVYTSEVLQKQGANTPVEGLRQLPSFVGNATTENNSNGGNGQAGINLRSIGQQNVLVLMNGRRLFLGGTENVGQADINAISIGATSRTEVLKDGASAIYGSDAVAGVVNFIMLNGPGEAPYEGAEMFLLYGNTTETDEHVRQAWLRGGVTGLNGKVSIAAVGEYYSKANLYSRDRAKLAGSGNLSNFGGPQGINPPSPGALGRGGINNNSPTFAGRVSVVTGPINFTTLGLPAQSGQFVLNNLSTNQVTPGSYRLFDVPAGTDPARFNFRAYTPARPAMEKAFTYVTGRYKIFDDALQFYADMYYAKTKQDNGLAPSPFTLSSASNGRNEARASLFNPFGNQLGSVRYRTVQENGNRRSFYDRDYWRYVAGLNGDFNFTGNGFISHFGYDTGLILEREQELNTNSGDETRADIRRLIAANIFNPFIGQNAPAVGTAPEYVAGVPTGRMIPYNNLVAGVLRSTSVPVTHVPAGGGAPVTENVFGAAYIGHDLYKERDWLADAKMNAHLFPNLYNGGLDVAVGYEHRELATQYIPDPVEGDPNLAPLGFNAGARQKFLQKVNSVFAELTFPFVTSTMNVPFVRSFELSLAWRYEKFNDKDQYTKATASFRNNNPNENFEGSPRVSLRYQPIADLTFRGNWNQSFRSPFPGTLFGPLIQNFPQLFDPIIHVTLQPPEGVAEKGNPGVTPELTDTYSAGVVYTPKWLPGFTITTDFYQLWTTNLILGSDDFAQVLLSTNTPDPDGNSLLGGGPALGITRNPDGTLSAIDSAPGNAGSRLVEGVDVTVVYEIPTTNFGTFTFSGGWNHFFIWKAGLGVPGFQDLHNFLGDYNNGTFPLAPGAVPFNKAFVRGEWNWKVGPGNLDFVATGNYVGDYEDDPNFIFGNDVVPGREGTLANPNFILHHRVSDYETLDLQLSYEFVKPKMEAAQTGYAKDAKDGKNTMSQSAVADNGSFWQRMLWGTKITVGCNNVFDRYPPTVLGAFNDNYDTSNYNIRNRYYYVSLDKKF